MIRIGLVAESRSDATRLIGPLIDRILRDALPEDANLDALRTLRGTRASRDFVEVKQIHRLAKEAGLTGFRGDRIDSDLPEVGLYLRALRLFAVEPEEERPHVVVLGRDVDGVDGRLDALDTVIRDRDWPFDIVSALANPEGEAWRIVTWSPRTKADHARADRLAQRLNFKPWDEPHRLHATTRRSDRDTKGTWRELVGDGDEDEHWASFDLRATSAGRTRSLLARSVREVHEQVVPRVQAVAGS
jgi:hypothetical protein